MAAIVLVHGIDQQQNSADGLENDWLPALAGGVRKAGFTHIADRIWRRRSEPGAIEARTAFYGHLFLRPGQQGDDPGDFTSEEEEFAEQLAREWLERAATRKSSPEVERAAARELAFVLHEVGQEEAGVGELGRKAIKGLAKVRWFAPTGMAFAERFVKRALAQVTRYLTDDTIRTAALESVLSHVGPETKVVIGHSLGSIVAYEAAHMIERPLPLLLTVGSPLGLDTIVYPRLRPQPPAFPVHVQRWVNLAARDDFIAAEPDLTNMFKVGKPEGAVFESGQTVDNGAQPHRAEFYLSKVEVGQPVGQALR